MLNGRRLGSKQKQKAARALVRSGKATAWNASDMPAFPRVHQTARRLAQLLALSASPMGVLRSEADLQRAAARVATASHELVLTTVGMDAAQTQLLFLRQWAGNLRHRAANVLLIGTDEATCHVARNASIPCFVDAMGHARKGEEQAAPLAAVDVEASAAGRGEVNMFGGQVRLKWFYVRALLRLGFHIVFSDADVAWLQDPFRNWDRSFDLQGLSDIYSTNLTVQAYHEITCMRPWLEQRYSKAKRSVYPCQSCGIFFVRSAVATRAFAEGLYSYVVYAADKWDQYIYQVCTPHEHC
jgi:hypothetical protein